jgi:hypothetical protein
MALFTLTVPHEIHLALFTRTVPKLIIFTWFANVRSSQTGVSIKQTWVPHEKPVTF